MRMWRGFEGFLPKKAICPCCAFSIQCDTNILEPFAFPGWSNAFKSCWFIQFTHQPRQQRHSSSAPDLHSAQRTSQVRFPVAPNELYNPNHIIVFQWTFSSATPSESSAAEPPTSAAVINWLNTPVGEKKSSTWNQGLGILTVERWRGMETMEGRASMRL